MNSLDRTVGRRIARLREKAGFTQAELAERSGVQPETISRYEAGKVSAPLVRLQNIADIFGLKIQDLLRAPSKDPAHDAAVDRLLLLAASLSPAEIELVMDVGSSAVKHVQRVVSGASEAMSGVRGRP